MWDSERHSQKDSGWWKWPVNLKQCFSSRSCDLLLYRSYSVCVCVCRETDRGSKLEQAFSKFLLLQASQSLVREMDKYTALVATLRMTSHNGSVMWGPRREWEVLSGEGRETFMGEVMINWLLKEGMNFQIPWWVKANPVLLRWVVLKLQQA